MKSLKTLLRMKSTHFCHKVRASFRRGTSVAVVAALLACPALGSIHYVMICNLHGAPHPSASMDASADTVGQVEFVVFGPGPLGPPFTVPLNEDGFASSSASTFPNLFDISGGQLAFVRVTVIGATSSAILRQKTGKSDVLLTVPTIEESLGRGFGIAVGDLERGAFVLIGNPNATDATISIRYGAPGTLPAATPRVLAMGALVYQVTKDHTQLVLESDQDVFVQYVVDSGSILKETFVPRL